MASTRSGSECAVKTTCASVPRILSGEQLDEAGLVVPAVDEAQIGAVAERLLELVAIALDRERGVVRCEHEADDRLRARRERRLGGVGDARRPVLHAGEHGQPELRFERSARPLGDRVQRRRVLDAEPAVALDEIGEVLRCDRPAAADVGVVRGDVGEALGRAVRHQDDGVARHARSRSAPARARRAGRARRGPSAAARRGRG